MTSFWILDFGFSIGGSEMRSVAFLALCALLFALRIRGGAAESKGRLFNGGSKIQDRNVP
jgi:hypothetical protein